MPHAVLSHVWPMQGPMLSIVVGLAPAHMRGTAFGIFYTVMAMTTMIANCVYGTVSGGCAFS